MHDRTKQDPASAASARDLLDGVLRYHQATKHHFSRFARSLGYLDWANQPDPFRRYQGSPLFALPILNPEAAGVRATGIGCFFDDPVHQVMGFQDAGFQSLYHFTIGGPVEDARLTTLPPYNLDHEKGDLP